MNAFDPTPNPGDDNVARLLDQAYEPPTVPAEFADSVRSRMLEIAAELRPTLPLLRPRRRRFAWVAAAAALLACIAAGFYFTAPSKQPAVQQTVKAPETTPPETPAPRPPVHVAEVIPTGSTLVTRAGEKRRVALTDGTTLYLNENTTVRCDADRRIALQAGEVFVEVAPRPDSAFVVQTPKRQVTALGTRFLVRADVSGTDVAVTQGKVTVSGLDGVMTAGQQLLAAATTVSTAPRASTLLGWARDLFATADAVLVPSAKFQGGAIVVVDSSGAEATLSLRKVHVDVHLEDGYARTTIDQTYFNHLQSRQEGTFYFPLPPDASLSRLAMYVDGNLMEGGMVERNEGRQIFESIVRRQKDPALLEWVDGNTFKMRVFPLEGRQEKRIVLSYTQKLNGAYGKAQYRFPSGHSLEQVGKWSFHARVKDGAVHAWQCDTHKLKATTDDRDLVLDAEAQNVPMERDVVLGLTDTHTGLSAADTCSFACSDHDGARYLEVRVRPDLKNTVKRQRRDWLFVVETSAERDALLARTQIEIVRNLLTQAEHDDTFALVTASSTPHVFDSERRPATKENAAAAIAFLEKAHLIGALDLERALETAAPLVKDAKNLHVVHVGSGLPIIGERRPEELVRRLPAGSRYVGVAVGKKWNRTFMKLAAEKSGGYVAQINPDEPIAWKTLELYSTLGTPSLLGVKIAACNDGKAVEPHVTFLCQSTAVPQGEEFCAVARLADPKAPLPETVAIRGTVHGKDFQREFKVEKVKTGADYLPRTWGRLEVERMIVEGAEQNKAALIALSKKLYVMTPYTSLIVLENEAMYAQYKVDRGRKDHWALYPCPDRIPVVYEPLQGMPETPVVEPLQGKLTAEQVLATVASRPMVSALANPEAERAWRNERMLKKTYMTPIQPEIMEAAIGRLPYGYPPQFYSYPMVQWDSSSPAITNPYLYGDAQYGLYGPYYPQGYSGNGQMNPYTNGRINYAPMYPQASPYLNLLQAPSSPAINYYQNVTPAIGGFYPGYLTTTDGSYPLLRGGSTYPPVLGSATSKPQTDSYRGNLQGDVLAARDRIVRLQITKGVDPVVLDEAMRYMLATRRDSLADPRFVNPRKTSDADRTWDERSNFRRNEVEKHLLELKLSDRAALLQQFDTVRRSQTEVDLDVYYLRLAAEIDRMEAERRKQQGGPYNPVPTGPTASRLLTQRPVLNTNPSAWRDLAGYAPGLRPSPADVRALLEAETADSGPPSGKIDGDARKRIDRARSAGWQAVTTPDSDVTLVCDGAGRYRLERVLPSALKEIMVCDGTALTALYPELGLGGRRPVSRHHRSEMSELVPWALAPAEDLARGADVLLVNDRTVAVVAAGRCVQLVFADNGRLAERQITDKPGGKVLVRETYDTDGTVRRIVDGKEIFVGTWKVRAADAPDLKVDEKEFVILPVPARTRDHVLKAHRVTDYSKAKPAVALELIAAEFALQNGDQRGDLVTIITNRFLKRGDHRLGFYVLLYSASLYAGPIPERKEKTPIEDYMARSVGDGWKAGPIDGFAAQMTAFRDLSQPQGQPTNTEAVLTFVKECRSPAMVWAIASHVYAFQPNDTITPAFKQKMLETVVGRVKGIPELEFPARYDLALCRISAGVKEGNANLRAVYEDLLQLGEIPPAYPVYRTALQHGDGGSYSVIADLVAKGLGVALLRMTEVTEPAGDAELVKLLTEGVKLAREKAPDRTALTAALLEKAVRAGDWELAEKLFNELIADERQARNPDVWRLGSLVAGNRKQTTRLIARLERALDLEFEQSCGVLRMENVRSDYQNLLGNYIATATARAVLEQKAPADFVARIMKTMDQWRQLDPAGMTAECGRIALLLRQCGVDDLAWDYETTAVTATAEAPAWLQMAVNMRQQGKPEQADRAYATAFALDPSNAQVLWDRASLLAQKGMTAKARELFGILVEGPWQPQYQHLQAQAKAMLEK